MQLTSAQVKLKERAAELSRGLVRQRGIEIDKSGEYPWDVVEALKNERFMGMTIPKELGGQGLSFLDAVLVIEEMAKSCTVTARIVVESNMGAISTVMAYGTDAQRKLAADLVLAGDKPAICITEPDAGSDAGAMTTRAKKRGNSYVINGRKHWITGAGVSRLHLIFARVFDEQGEELGIGGFLAIRGEADGLRMTRRESTLGLCGMPEGELLFEDLEVMPDMVLLPPSGFKRGFADLINAYNSQRVGAGTVAMGVASGAFEHAVAWVKNRRQFGRPIAEFQGLQWMLADMQTQLTASRLMLYAAAASRGVIVLKSLSEPGAYRIVKVVCPGWPISLPQWSLTLSTRKSTSRDIVICGHSEPGIFGGGGVIPANMNGWPLMWTCRSKLILWSEPYSHAKVEGV